MGRNNADFGNSTPDWQSPWPKGHQNRTEYVSPEQQTANSRGPAKQEYRTEYDKSSNSFMTKSDYQAKHGWVSAWPQGHPNHTPAVSREEQTQNARRQSNGR